MADLYPLTAPRVDAQGGELTQISVQLAFNQLTAAVRLALNQIGSGGTFNNPTIVGGTIDGSVIGGLVPEPGSFTTLTVNGALLSGASGSAQVGFLQSGSGAVLRTVQSKEKEDISADDFGAVPDWNGSTGTDNTPAMVLALASGSKLIRLQAKDYFFASGFTIPDGVTLEGQSMVPGKVPTGTRLIFANGVATCVTLTTGSNLQTACLKKVVVTRVGTPPASSTGIFIDRAYNVVLQDVYSLNHARLYSFFAFQAGGLGAFLTTCFGSSCTENYFYFNNWPECRVVGGRMGSNTADVAGNAFIYITGTDNTGVSPGIGPNTLCFEQVQFNQGVAGPSYWVEFDSVLPAQGNQVVYLFDTCHVENITSAYIKTTSTAPYLQRFRTVNCDLNTNVPLFAVDAATQVNQCNFSTTYIAGSVTLATNSLINRLTFNGVEFGGAVSITGAAIQNNMQAIACFFDAGVTFAGVWSSLVAKGVGTCTVTATKFNTGSYIDINVSGKIANTSGNVIVGQSGVAASVTGTLSETTLASVVIPAGMLGLNGVLRITALWSATNNANTKSCVYRLGGTPICSTGITSFASYQDQRNMRNRGALNSQINFVGAASFGSGSGVAPLATAIDTSVDKTLTLTAILTNTSDTVTLEGYTVEILPG